MLIKFGSIVVDGRGKLGGQVYSKNRGGSYVRNNAIPVNPRTEFQQQSRAILTQLSQQWSTLTQQQIDAWNSATERFKRNNVFGDARRLSGKNLFTSLNKNLIDVSLEPNLFPPSPEEIIVPTSISVVLELDDGELLANVTGEATSQMDNIIVRATPPVSKGTSFVKNLLRKIALQDDAQPGVAFNVGDDYITRFGAPKDGDKIFFAISTTNSAGQKSPEVITYGIVEAI